MHPYNFETQKLILYLFPLLKLIIIVIITDLGQDIVRNSEQLIKKWPACLTKCWMLCNEKSTCVDEDNDEMKELLGINYVSIGHF